MPPKLGVLAGGGQLPGLVVAACRAERRPCFVVAFPGFTDPAVVVGVPHTWTPLERVGAILRRLHEEEVEEVVLAGPVQRPSSWLALRPDWRGLRLLLKMLRRWRGDDHVLSRVVREIEGDGFRVVGAEAVAPDLLMTAGALGTHRPDAAQGADIALGAAAARELGRYDRGQAVIVAAGRVIGREGPGGTAALLRDVADTGAARGGILVKVAKPGQERRVDLPSVGVETLGQASRAGLAGIALEAGGALVLDRHAVTRAAEDAGLFVVGINVAEHPG